MRGKITKLLRTEAEKVAVAKQLPAEPFMARKPHPRIVNPRKALGRFLRRSVYGMPRRTRRKVYAALRLEHRLGSSGMARSYRDEEKRRRESVVITKTEAPEPSGQPTFKTGFGK